jgi:hypothetical protein
MHEAVGSAPSTTKIKTKRPAEHHVCTATLTYDLVRGVTSKSKAGSFGVDFHCSPQGLLGPIGHAEGQTQRQFAPEDLDVQGQTSHYPET